VSSAHSFGIGRSAVFKIVAVFILLGAAMWLRIQGAEFDRPYVFHPDEWLLVKPAMHMAATSSIDPHTFWYPTFLPYLETGVVEIVHFFTGAPLVVDPVPINGTLPAYALADVDPSQYPYVEWGRTLVGVIGVLTVLTMVFAGMAARRRNTEADSQASGDEGNRTWLAGMCGAVFVALAVLPTVNSRFVTTDIPAAFFCAATMAVTLLAISRSPDRTSNRLLILAGLLAGLAASTKYNAVVVAAVPALGYLMRAGSVRALPGWLPGALRSRTPYLSGLAGCAGFLLATPMLILNPRAVLSGIHYQIVTYNVLGHAGYQGDSARYYINYVWTTGFGPVLVTLTVAGLAWALIRHRKADLLLAVFAIGYFALVSIPTVRFERNLLPLVPFVALLAGRFVSDLAFAVRDRLAGRSPRLASAAVVVLLAALAVQPAIVAARDAQAQYRPDTRTVALEWAQHNLPEGAAVVRESYTPQLSADRYHPGYVDTLSFHSLDWYRDHGFRYAIASSAMYARYVAIGGAPAEFYRDLFSQPTLYRLEPDSSMNGPTIVIVDLGAK
jgi:hypothetical protein